MKIQLERAKTRIAQLEATINHLHKEWNREQNEKLEAQLRINEILTDRVLFLEDELDRIKQSNNG